MSLDAMMGEGGDGVDGSTPDVDAGGGILLMAHERLLSADEQRRIVASRRQGNDGVDEDDKNPFSGRRGRRWGADQPPAGQELNIPSASSDGGVPLKTDSENGANSGGCSGGGRVERPTEETISGVRGAPLVTDSAPLINDTRNASNPLFNSVLSAVEGLDPAKYPLSRSEQINIAGALTAGMANTPGFDLNAPGASNISLAFSQGGDRIFLINNPNPGAPNAVYASVDLDQARHQSLEQSTQLAAAQAVPKQDPPTQDALAQNASGQNLSGTPNESPVIRMG
ncbi:MAG: hypothetical protein E6Q88_05210 [Lysobacteraceae bacterium]|nr:MAG: hypothetical protein E6Q88_05210 [Xanthomonadaceae bacterium]